jgi:hypothetical protein
MPSRTYQVTLGTAAKLIAWYAADRESIVIRNDSGATVYIGPDASIRTTTGAALATGVARSWYKRLGDSVNRPFYGIAGASSKVVTVEEEIRDGEY